MNRSLNRATFTVAVLSFLLLSDAAFAQAIGGTFLSGLLDYARNNIVPTLGVIGIIFAGGFLLAGRMGIYVILGICAGVYVMANADNLYGLIKQ